MNLLSSSVKLTQFELVGLKMEVMMKKTLFILGTLLEDLLLVEGFFYYWVILCLEAGLSAEGRS